MSHHAVRVIVFLLAAVAASRPRISSPRPRTRIVAERSAERCPRATRTRRPCWQSDSAPRSSRTSPRARARTTGWEAGRHPRDTRAHPGRPGADFNAPTVPGPPRDGAELLGQHRRLESGLERTSAMISG